MPDSNREKAGTGRRRKSALDQLDRIFEETCGRILVQPVARDRAYRRAQEQLDEAGGSSRVAGVALLGYAIDLFVAHAVELAASQRELGELLERIDSAGLIPRVSLSRATLRAPELLQLPAAVSVEVELGLLRAFVDATAVSLWTLGRDGQLRQVAHAGSFDAARPETRRLARDLVGGTKKPERVRGLLGLQIELRGQPAAAVIARGKGVASTGRRSILESAEPMLAAMLERDEGFARGSHSGEAIIASAERRLARLRFDLHDGPQQDVALLAEDLHLLRSQLENLMDGHPERGRVLGRFDDLQARLVALDGDLRRISAFVQSPFLQGDSVPEALAKLADDFASRSSIEAELQVEGDFTSLTDSQQITLLGLIREALSNVREHSQAANVTVAVSAGADGVEATITDDGRGFDPERTLVEAARGGHLGLVGMHERVQMLGGSTQIDSRPGGPTIISVTLPRFEGGV
jgi:signal transduction histidine kinase